MEKNGWANIKRPGYSDQLYSSQESDYCTMMQKFYIFPIIKHEIH